MAKEQRGGDCKGGLSCHLSILEVNHESPKVMALTLILR